METRIWLFVVGWPTVGLVPSGRCLEIHTGQKIESGDAESLLSDTLAIAREGWPEIPSRGMTGSL